MFTTLERGCLCVSLRDQPVEAGTTGENGSWLFAFVFRLMGHRFFGRIKSHISTLSKFARNASFQA